MTQKYIVIQNIRRVMRYYDMGNRHIVNVAKKVGNKDEENFEDDMDLIIE